MGVRQWGFQIADEKNRRDTREMLIAIALTTVAFIILFAFINRNTSKKTPTHSFRIYIVPEVPNHNRKI